ncbi:MAG: 3-hydroxyacyl-CoA dehydrogenase NAD-binding domain-containing protein, partial [Gemmatimonadota bacterium]
MAENIQYSVDANGVAVIAMAFAGNRPNTWSESTTSDFSEAFGKAVAEPAVKGIVITSSKSDFHVGADLEMLSRIGSRTAEELYAACRNMQNLFRMVETCGKTVVAAINGTAVGGGFELALACHARIVADNPAIRLGLPETQLGLLPGAGGTQRLPRIIGIREALGMINTGKTIAPKKALELKLVQAVVPADQLLETAKSWAQKSELAVQPWDQKGFRVPDGEVHSPRGFETFAGVNSLTLKETWGNYAAPRLATHAVYHGLQMPIDQGCKVEARNFTWLARSASTQNMIRTLFFSMKEAKGLKSRPKNVPVKEYTKIGVLGAGLMGHGITYCTVTNGIDVVLLDTTVEAADKGKAAVAKAVEDAVKKGRLTQAKAGEALGRIKTTASYDDLKDCQLIVEAVFESREIKNDVTRRVEAVIAPDVVFGSNTSTLPITGLADASTRPDQFIGLHFFSPVEKMPLVEVILGAKTSDVTLAQSLDFVKAIGKTPVVVRDGRAFYTSRVFGTYLTEGVAMLREGVNPSLIDHAGRLAGMPMGSLTVADMTALDLSWKIINQTKADLGDKFVEHPSAKVFELMVGAGRYGQKNKAGFYDYLEGGEKRLWPELTTHFPTAKEQPSVDDVKRRLLHIQAVELLRCMEEGIVMRPQDADVGSILGWGFCPFYGGLASYVDYVGAKTLESECDDLAKKHGARFAPP